MDGKKLIKKLPVVGRVATRVNTMFRNKSFEGSEAYWEARYSSGGDSGCGSYNQLAEFKARVLNDFVIQQEITSVIEFGCGDGNQLTYAKYPRYIGLDVSQSAIKRCIQRFDGDCSKSFLLYNSGAFSDKAGFLQAELSMSLDVLYHIVEDNIYNIYLDHLFSAARRFVAVYSSNYNSPQERHCKHRAFTEDVSRRHPKWALLSHVKNAYPRVAEDVEKTSAADFYIYRLLN